MTLDLAIEFNGQNLHRIGRYYPLNIPLCKYVYFTGLPIDAIFLNYFAVCVNNDIPHTDFFANMIQFSLVCSF